jgi:hypothetical protein
VAVHQCIVDRMAARVACLTRVVCAAGSGHDCSPRGLLEEKGGRHGNRARPATSFNGGSYLLSTTRGSGQGEMKVGAALDAVESGRGIGAFYRSRNGRRRAVKE